MTATTTVIDQAELEARCSALLTIALDQPEPSTDLAGWFYEPADPEVGIRCGMWIHEDCPAPESSGDAAECYPVPGGETIVCPDCGQSRLVDYTASL